MRQHLLLTLVLLSGCSREQAPATPAPPPPEPVVDALSQVVSERVREEALRRRAAALPQEGTPDPNAPPPPPTCSRVACADLDGDGAQEILCWHEGRLTFWQQTESALFEVFHDPSADQIMPGEPRALHVADFDHDGREEIFLGWGMTRTQTDVPLTVSMIEVNGASGSHKRVSRVLYRGTSPRPEIVAVGTAQADQKGDDEIFFAAFDSQYFVTAWQLTPQGASWGTRQVARRRMATSWAFTHLDRNGQVDLIAGRPYGDEKLAPGDLVVIRDGKRPELVPTHLGVRSVAVAQLEKGGAPTLLFGDGWHYRYGTDARGRLSRAQAQAGGTWSTALIEDTAGQYEIAEILPVDIEGDGRDEIVAAGNKEIRLWRWTPEGALTSTRIAEGSQAAIGHLLRPGQPWVVVPGAPLKTFLLE